MKSNLENYFTSINEPWGDMFYDLVYAQLDIAEKKLKILDFGSGFGKTANRLAECHDVTAIEVNSEMVNNRYCSNNYEQILSDESVLSEFPTHYFDLIICHNVLEYIETPREVCDYFSKLLKEDGRISIVKHNFIGSVLNAAVLLDDPGKALNLLNHNMSVSESFGTINYYSEESLSSWLSNDKLKCTKKMGLRSLYGLSNNNAIKYEKKWYEEMKQLELSLSETSEFISISFFHHLIFVKK